MCAPKPPSTTCSPSTPKDNSSLWSKRSHCCPTALGGGLRAAREARGVTVAALAEQADLTKGFISQLERGLSQASVTSLQRICSALDLSPGAILDPLREGPVAPADAPEISFGGQGARDRLLTPAGFPGFQVLHATVQPYGRNLGTSAPRPDQSHFVLVLHGTFTVTVNGAANNLTAGQSITFRGTDTYSWANPSPDTPCEVLWVLATRALTGQTERADQPRTVRAAQQAAPHRRRRRRFHSSGLAVSRSWTVAAVTSTVRSSPIVSRTMCRLRPLTFFPAS
jgi:transcriptional regulator with XRE-family HTH domain